MYADSPLSAELREPDVTADKCRLLLLAGLLLMEPVALLVLLLVVVLLLLPVLSNLLPEGSGRPRSLSLMFTCRAKAELMGSSMHMCGRA
jgi:hypothetical protein